MKKNKKKFVSVIKKKLTLIPASAQPYSVPKVILKVNNAGMGQ